MKLTSEHFKSLHPLYITQLKKTLDMNKKKALRYDGEGELWSKGALEMHLGRTRTHVTRVNRS